MKNRDEITLLGFIQQEISKMRALDEVLFLLGKIVRYTNSLPSR